MTNRLKYKTFILFNSVYCDTSLLRIFFDISISLEIQKNTKTKGHIFTKKMIFGQFRFVKHCSLSEKLNISKVPKKIKI